MASRSAADAAPAAGRAGAGPRRSPGEPSRPTPSARAAPASTAGRRPRPEALRQRFGRSSASSASPRSASPPSARPSLIWLIARVIAGTAMYLFAYGAALMVVVAVAIAPRNLKLTGERTGLFPRGREGDRFDVDAAAHRQARADHLHARGAGAGAPRQDRARCRSPSCPAAATVELGYALRCARRGVYQVGPLVAVAQDPLGLFQRETVVCRALRAARPPPHRARLRPPAHPGPRGPADPAARQPAVAHGLGVLRHARVRARRRRAPHRVAGLGPHRHDHGEGVRAGHHRQDHGDPRHRPHPPLPRRRAALRVVRGRRPRGRLARRAPPARGLRGPDGGQRRPARAADARHHARRPAARRPGPGRASTASRSPRSSSASSSTPSATPTT